MGFNTLPFIFIFLPVFLAVYYLMPERLRNGVLTLGSLVFSHILHCHQYGE